MTTTTKQPTLRTDRRLRRFSDIREMLPDVDNPSPLVKLHRLGPDDVQAFLKLEWLNPFGSVKDRTARYLLDSLIEAGLADDSEIVEASSGNTAIALAALAGLMELHLTTTVPDGVPEAKKVTLRMLGAEVWETPDDLCPVDHPRDGAIALARSITAADSRNVSTEQYENPANVKAHYETTGPEIWSQTDGRIDWFVAGLGTTGTVVGAGRFLKEKDPNITVVGVEAEPGHRIPGMKSFEEASVPGIFDPDVVDQSIVIPDSDAYATTKDLWRREGLMAGPSTGSVVAAINRLDTKPGEVVVGISADSGTKYTSYFAEILGEEGTPRI